MIRTAEPNDYASEILFYLPQESDPLEPKLAHLFVLGEVQISTTPVNPGDPITWIDVALDHIVERGEGWYAIRLTEGQRASAMQVAYQAVCADAQPDRGTEIIDDALGGDIAENAAGLVPFYLPDEDDPIGGTPIEGHTFIVGQVKLSLPDDLAFGNVDLSAIVEFGGGVYGVQLDATQTTKRGKVIVVADVPGAQRFSGHRTILGDGSGVTPTPPTPSPSIPAPDAESSSVGDLALTWSNTTGDADLSLVLDAADQAVDIATDQGLATAVILSLFVDRRAEDDDKPPSEDPTDRRGWWADEFAEVEGDRIGSRLWLLDRSKLTYDLVPRAREYAREALAWLLEDRVVSSVDVVAERTATALLLAIELKRPGRDPVTLRFAPRWDHMQEATTS
jgi:phage gp46-like protein